MQSNLKNLAEELRGKYILCICEGKAEEARFIEWEMHYDSYRSKD